MSIDNQSEYNQIDLDRVKADLPKRWKFLLSANAVLTAVLVLQLTGAQILRGAVEGSKRLTELLQTVPPLKVALNQAAHGVPAPPSVIEDIVSEWGNVEDGNTSDRNQAYRKTTQICVRTTRPDAELVPGSAHFVADVQTIETSVEPIPGPPNTYCVLMAADTSAKERLARVHGRIYARQRRPGVQNAA